MKTSTILLVTLAAMSSAPAAAATQLRFNLTGDVDATWVLPQTTPIFFTGFGWIASDIPMVFEGVERNLQIRWESLGGSSGAIAISEDGGFPALFLGFGTRFFTGTFSTVTFLKGTYTFEGDIGGIEPGNGTLTISAIPEPATWAMLITGFGLIGAAARRRRPAITHA